VIAFVAVDEHIFIRNKSCLFGNLGFTEYFVGFDGDARNHVLVGL